MYKKRMLCVLVAVCVAAGLAFAGGGGESAASTAGRIMPTAPGRFPVVETPVTLTMFAPQFPTIENIETNLLTLEYEQMTNVKIEWRLAPQQGFAEARNLLLASGNYPEIMIAAGIPPADQMLYGSQGVFLPLNDLIDEWTVSYKQLLETIPDLREVITAPDGSIYSIGYDQQCFHCTVPQRLWVSGPWLDRLGLSVPTTTEEFYQVLRAFKTQDANGNGDPNDEIPFAGVLGSGSDPIPALMNAFILYNTPDMLLVNSGVIDVAFNKPEWREGLRFVKRLYDENLMDPTSLTMQMTQLRQIATRTGDNILGAATGLGGGAFGSWAGERWLEYVIVPPLVGPGGNQITQRVNTAVNGTMSITNVAQHPEVAMRWVDWFLTTEGALRLRIGREGHEWAWGGPGDEGLNGQQAIWKKLTPIGTVQNFFWGQAAFPQTFDHSTQAREGIEGPLYDAALVYRQHVPEEYLLPIWVGVEDIQEYAQLRTELNDFVAESLARFISGDLNVETGWQEYTRTLQSIGLNRYLELVNKWYRAKYRS